jgi:hypothetical protein
LGGVDGASAPSPAAETVAEPAWSGWNNWADARADARIAASLDGVADAVAEALAVSDNELRNEIVAAFRKRDERIATLEGKLDTLLAIIGGPKSAEVVPLPGRKHA